MPNENITDYNLLSVVMIVAFVGMTALYSQNITGNAARENTLKDLMNNINQQLEIVQTELKPTASFLTPA